MFIIMILVSSTNYFYSNIKFEFVYILVASDNTQIPDQQYSRWIPPTRQEVHNQTTHRNFDLRENLYA